MMPCTMSWIDIQLSHWLPSPMRPPIPSLKNGSCAFRAPPVGGQHHPGAQICEPCGCVRRGRSVFPGTHNLREESLPD